MTSGLTGGTSSGVDVTIRYWASARAAAGCDSDHFAGARLKHVGDVLEAAAATHSGLGAVLAVSTILMDGRSVTPAELLPESLSEPLSGASSESSSQGIILEVLPPFAGG
jgi:sulfur-carrier protein